MKKERFEVITYQEFASEDFGGKTPRDVCIQYSRIQR